MNDFTFLSPTRLVVGRDAEKETGKWKWTILSFLIPTVMGIAGCIIFSNIAKIFI